jgi:cell division septal protein FtsQ
MSEEIENIDSEQETREYGKHVYLYFFLIGITVLASYGMKSQWQQHIPVRSISVEGINIISRDEIVHLLNLPPHSSMYNLDLTILQKNVYANSFVKNVVIKRDAPNVLRVEIEERKPTAMIVRNTDVFYIDDEGVLLPYVSTNETYDIPIISGIDSIAGLLPGMKMTNSDILSALEIIRTSKLVNDELFHTISEIKLRKGKDIILYSFDTGVPIIFGQGDAAKKLVKLDEFWKRFIRNTDTGTIQYIDVRFDDQVVVSHKTS